MMGHEEGRCACGLKATHMDPHMDGDAPPEFCEACYIAEMIKLECEELKELLLRKNKAYGNSALDPVRIFSKAPVDEQIRVRLDDKLTRLKRGESAGEDVELDLMGYLILLRISRRYQV